MSRRSFSPFGQSPMPYLHSASVFSQQGYASDESPSPYGLPPGASFSEMQAFCNMARESAASPSLNSSFHLGSQTHHYTLDNSMDDFQRGNECNQEYVEEEDDGADMFDLEALGLFENGEEVGDFDFLDERFDFPVPTEPVLPMEQLQLQKFDDQMFYVDFEGYVQVFTQGECRVPFRGPAAIGAWFGPNHPMNVGERLTRGRQTREAAQFAAVIEAIKVAGSCGVKKLQVNTDYVNIIRFVTYFILKWEHNGWMTVKGTGVKNQDLVRELDHYINYLDIKWNLVPYEDGVEGNYEASLLANEALDLQLPGAKPSEETGTSPNEVSNVKKPRHKPIVY